MKKAFRNWGAVIILALMFVGSWLGQWTTQWTEYVSEQEAHSQPADLDGFLPEFWQATFENWQSEFLQLVFQAILVASWIGGQYLFRADYAADKEDVERIMSELNAIKAEFKKEQG
jgi:hypothetical protein